MTLFANLFEQSKADTALFTDRNPFFGADATARRQELKVERKAHKGTESVDAKTMPTLTTSKTQRTAKRRRKECSTDELPQEKHDEELHGEDDRCDTGEQGGKQRKGSRAKGVTQEEGMQEGGQPGLKKPKKAAHNAQLGGESEDAQDEFSSDDKDVQDAQAPGSLVREGESEAETLKRTIFVGNLPQGTASKDLKRLFKRFGSIESVRIRSLAATADVKMSKALQVKAGKTDSSKGSVNAYVLFSAAEHADAAHALNMTKIDGQHIRVDRAAPPKDAKSAGSVHYDSRRSVFVGNLPRDVQEEDLISMFNSGEEHPALEGAVEAVRVVRDHHCRVGKGIAYILFRTKVAALAALRMHGSKCGAREMRVMRVQSSNKDGTGKGAKRLQNKKMTPGGVHKKMTPGGVHKKMIPGGVHKKMTPGGVHTKGKDGAPKSGKSQSGAPQSSKKKRAGKRPAVAARKMKAALAV